MYRFATCLFLLAAPLHADVLVIDDDGGPGVDFTDIPPAILAAGNGDTLEVRAGAYSSFTLDRGLRVVGRQGAVVAGGATVSSTSQRTIAIVADLSLGQLSVQNCAGTVVLDGLTLQGQQVGARLSVINSDDVRVHACVGVAQIEKTGVLVQASRLEIVSSSFTGGRGVDEDCGSPGDGDAGMLTNNSRVQSALSTIQGGRGGNNFATCISFCGIDGGGDGGPGMVTAGASTEIFLAGKTGDLVKGGYAGLGEDCPCDGYPGAGLEHNAGTVRYSNVSIEAGDALCTGGPDVTGPGTLIQAVPADLTLERLGTPVPGGSVTLRVHGTPGTNIRFYVGKSPVQVAAANPAVIERLTSENWVKPLELMPASGFIDVGMLIPVNATVGNTFYCQASAVDIATQTFQRSNSIPILVR
ncbi:MAG: hypothetical protein GY711_21280 [bacterium]|nr:hypothetical protein [bacterium]